MLERGASGRSVVVVVGRRVEVTVCSSPRDDDVLLYSERLRRAKSKALPGHTNLRDCGIVRDSLIANVPIHSSLHTVPDDVAPADSLRAKQRPVATCRVSCTHTHLLQHICTSRCHHRRLERLIRLPVLIDCTRRYGAMQYA